MHHRLAGGGADVVAGRVELFVEEGFRLPEEGEEGDPGEDVGDVPVGVFRSELRPCREGI